MKPTPSAYARLLAQPQRFRFDAAVRVLTRAAREPDPAEAMRFHTAPGVAMPPADIPAIAPPAGGRGPAVTVALMGLTGAMGVLPRYYSEVLAQTLRNRSRAMTDFLDLLSHRFVAMFARAATKYRLHRAAEEAALAEPPRPDGVSSVLLALTGYGTPGMADRLAVGVAALQHYAGLFATHPRSADRLEALASDWLGRPVEVRQFEGAWLFLPPGEQTRLALGRRLGQHSRLGHDAVAGVRSWDVQARIVLRVGPLDRAGFEALLPDRAALRQLVSLVRAFVGFETGFAVNPVLAEAAIPELRLSGDADPAPRLGWNTWIPDPRGKRPDRRGDAADARFDAEIVEAEADRLSLAGRGGAR